ncbi:class I SAM-dependent methyltransferase [Cyanobacteria bacterium FACHB-471]|nr:class I SAM-dependent methyltransferase [Cyanobacteria bacterium FACHB-471]
MSDMPANNLVSGIATAVKQGYVLLFRGLRSLAKSIGLLGVLEAHKNNRTLFWLRSLFAIYDMDDMIRLGVPWWTFSSIDLVERFLANVPQARVFEYGAGASTLWLAQRAGAVYFLEHDAVYKKSLDRYTAGLANAKGFLEVPVPDKSPEPFTSSRSDMRGMSFRNYVKHLDAVDGLFDLIIIDGRCREQCLEQALPRLKKTGCIVFDNSGRKRYRRVIEQLNYPMIETRGLTPSLPYPGQTTLIFKSVEVRNKLQAK